MNEPIHSPSAGGMSLSLLLHALRQQRWTILSFLGAVLLAALAGTLATTPEYRAITVIQLMSHAGKELDVRAVIDYDNAGYLEQRDRARTQIQIMLSRSVREEVIRRYNELGYDDIPDTPDGAAVLKDAISVGPREDTQLVEIRVLHPDPERAAVLANLVATVYQAGNLELRTGTARETQVWLETQADGYQSVLDEANQKLIDFKREYGLVDIEEKVDDISRRLASLQIALGDVTTERVLLSSALLEYERLLSLGSYTVLAALLEDAPLETMSEERASLIARSAEVMADYTEQHPEYQRALGHVARLEQVIAGEVQSRIEGDRARIRILQSQEYLIHQELNKVKEELLEKQRLMEEYSRLKLDQDRLRRLHQSLGDREGEVQLQADTRLNNVRVIDPALPPTSPWTPNLPLTMAMALMVGLAGGVGLALLRHQLSAPSLTARDIKQKLNAPLLGVLPRLPDGVSAVNRALFPFNHPSSPSSEAFRGVCEALQADTKGRPYRLLVTSSLAGEGKTTTSIGLAIAFSRSGVRTLLLDADLRRPHQHTMFGVNRGPGLTEALEKPGRDPLVTPTEVPHLDLLVCGGASQNPDEVLSSPALARLLGTLGQRYQMIIIDSPPTAQVADALTLTRVVDGVLLVARRGGVTERRTVETLEALGQADARLLGVVLNDEAPSSDALGFSADGTSRRAAAT